MSQTYEDKPTLAAWNAKLGKMEPLHSETLESNTLQVEIDLSYIDWNDWEAVAVFVGRQQGGLGSSTTCNPLTTTGLRSTYGSAGWGIIKGDGGPAMIFLLPRHNAENHFLSLAFADGGGVAWERYTFSVVTGLQFTTTNGYFQAGAEITIWGIQ